MTTMTANIYDSDGMTITQGLQSGMVCDHAFQTARKLAAHRNSTVVVEDKGLQQVYTVRADGTRGPAPADWVAQWADSEGE